MAIDRDALAADLAGMIDDLSETFEWSGATYRCAISDTRRVDKVTEFAADSEIALMVRLLIDDLPEGQTPAPRDRVLVNDVRYEVMETMLDRDGVGIRVALREDRRNRP